MGASFSTIVPAADLSVKVPCSTIRSNSSPPRHNSSTFRENPHLTCQSHQIILRQISTSDHIITGVVEAYQMHIVRVLKAIHKFCHVWVIRHQIQDLDLPLNVLDIVLQYGRQRYSQTSDITLQVILRQREWLTLGKTIPCTSVTSFALLIDLQAYCLLSVMSVAR